MKDSVESSTRRSATTPNNLKSFIFIVHSKLSLIQELQTESEGNKTAGSTNTELKVRET